MKLQVKLQDIGAMILEEERDVLIIRRNRLYAAYMILYLIIPTGLLLAIPVIGLVQQHFRAPLSWLTIVFFAAVESPVLCQLVPALWQPYTIVLDRLRDRVTLSGRFQFPLSAVCCVELERYGEEYMAPIATRNLWMRTRDGDNFVLAKVSANKYDVARAISLGRSVADFAGVPLNLPPSLSGSSANTRL